uniref:C-type lectin domain-containing protein n=1 Tax=Oryzias melastigma TaxID=30732 RepID=A0A3B3E0L1_ORYME
MPSHKRARRPWTLCPTTKSFGLNTVVPWTTSLAANIIHGNASSQSPCNWTQNETMSWSSAQQYCRENYKDLAMIENQEENMEALKAKPNSSIVWIGLYREPWTWSDGTLSSFRNWEPSGLNNVEKRQHCALENPQHQWADEFCDVPWVFVCQTSPP